MPAHCTVHSAAQLCAHPGSAAPLRYFPPLHQSEGPLQPLPQSSGPPGSEAAFKVSRIAKQSACSAQPKAVRFPSEQLCCTLTLKQLCRLRNTLFWRLMVPLILPSMSQHKCILGDGVMLQSTTCFESVIDDAVRSVVRKNNLF